MTPIVHASYACHPDQDSGRLFAESPSRLRSPFQRDRDRILHSTAFRRLQYKTQVFVYHEGDHFRSRLTHSLEVAQIAGTMANTLGVDRDLSEAIALAHDLGHTPFGHAGEEALNEMMQPFGGFQHNLQTLRLLCRLEKRYPNWDGLNLTWQTLEGVVKHNGPITDPNQQDAIQDIIGAIKLSLTTFPGLEAQIAGIADDIAYLNHDIDDGLRAGLFTLEDLEHLPLIGSVIQTTRTAYPHLDDARLSPEIIRRLMGLMIDAVLNETQQRLDQHKPRITDDIRQHSSAFVGFEPRFNEKINRIRQYLYQHMYKSQRVMHEMAKGREIIQTLFRIFLEDPSRLPPEWTEKAIQQPKSLPRLTSDYIAGMTDRYAILEYQRMT